MSKEQEEAMEVLGRNASRTPNRYEGIKAVEVLAAYGKEAIPKLLEVSDNTGLAEPSVKQAAKSEIDRIKKDAKPWHSQPGKHRGNNYNLATWIEKRFKA